MNRPSRQLAHLEAKIAAKATQTPKKVGKRAKRWKKFADLHKAAVAQG